MARQLCSLLLAISFFFVTCSSSEGEINLKALPRIQVTEVVGGYRLILSGSGIIDSAINTATLPAGTRETIIEIEINGNSAGITTRNERITTFTAFPNVQRIFIYGNVALSYQTFCNFNNLVSLRVESSYLVTLAISSFYGCTMLDNIVLRANIKIGCWTFGGCTNLKRIYYYGTNALEYDFLNCGEYEKPETFDEGRKADIFIYVPFNSTITEFANALPENIIRPSDAVISGDLVYLFRGNRIEIRGNGSITIATLNSLASNKFICDCESLAKFTEVDIVSLDGRITSEGSATRNSPVFRSFSNLAIVRVTGNVTLSHYMFESMQSIRTLRVNADEYVTLLDSAFENSGVSDVIMSGPIRSGCWVFHNCGNLKDLYYCGNSNPIKESENNECNGYAKPHIFTGTAANAVIHVPFESPVTEFGEKNPVYDANVFTDDAGVKYAYGGSKLNIFGSGHISKASINSLPENLPERCETCSSNSKFTELVIDGIGGTLSTDGMIDRTALFQSLANLEKVTLKGITEINRHAFRNMGTITTLNVESKDENRILLGDSAFELTGLTDIEIQGPIRLGTWTFDSCSKITSFFYCSYEAPVRDTYYPNDAWIVFSGIEMPLITVHVPFQSKATSFAEIATTNDGNSYSIRNGNLNFIFLGNVLKIYGHGCTDSCTGSSNTVIRNFLNRGSRCGSCSSYDEITEIIFEGDGQGVLTTTYWTPNSAYLGFLPMLETVRVLDNVAISRFLVYGMTTVKNFILTSNTNTKIGKATFQESKIEYYTLQGDISIGEYAFHNCQDSIKEICLCGRVSYIYDDPSQPNHIFTPNPSDFTPSVHIPSTSSLTSFDTVTSEMLIRDANIQRFGSLNYTFDGNRLEITGSGTVRRDDLNRINYSKMCISCVAFDKIESVVFTSNADIESGSFDRCSSLKAVDFNQQMTTIASSSFSNCALETLVIPPHVTRIESSAFSNNSHLSLVRYCGVTDPGRGFSGQFSGCPSVRVEVPSNDQNFAGYTGDSFCSVVPNKVLGHNYCGISTFSFTNTNDFSPSSDFNFSLSYSPSETHSNSIKFTETNHFSMSNHLSNSNKFTTSFQFVSSRDFSESYEFSITSDFSITQNFLPSLKFSSSNFFKDFNQFSKSSNSVDFSEAGYFTASYEFEKPSITEIVEKSLDRLSSVFISSEVALLTKSHSILESSHELDSVTKNIDLGTSSLSKLKQSSINTLTSVENVNKPTSFVTHAHSTERESQSKEKTTSEAINISQDDANVKSNKGSAVGISVGVAVGVVVIVCIVLLIIFLRKRDKREAVNNSCDEMETESFTTEESNTSNYPNMFAGTQDENVWTSVMDSQIMDIQPDENEIDFNFEEAYI